MQRDWWCEKRLFGDIAIPIAEPLSACTGLVMVVLFVLPNTLHMEKKQLPALFVWVKASFIVLGIGTILFHSVDPEDALNKWHVNLNMFDWLPLVWMSASLFMLYAHALVVVEWRLYLYLGVMAWSMLLMIGMDSETYDFWDSYEKIGWGFILNGILLSPLFCMLLYASVTHLKHRSMRLWFLLIGSLVLWIVNVTSCAQVHGFAVLHALYHVVMSVALVHAACLGLTLNGEWDLGKSAYISLKVVSVEPVGNTNFKCLFTCNDMMKRNQA